MPTSKKTIQGFSPSTSQTPGLMQIIAMKSTLILWSKTELAAAPNTHDSF